MFYCGWLMMGAYWFYHETNQTCQDSLTFLMMRCSMIDQLIFPICACWLWGPRTHRYDVSYDEEGASLVSDPSHTNNLGLTSIKVN